MHMQRGFVRFNVSFTSNKCTLTFFRSHKWLKKCTFRVIQGTKINDLIMHLKLTVFFIDYSLTQEFYMIIWTWFLWKNYRVTCVCTHSVMDEVIRSWDVIRKKIPSQPTLSASSYLLHNLHNLRLFQAS